MKKILMISLLVCLSGCVSEKVYTTGKVIHAGVKTVYMELPATSTKLEELDKVIVGYDKIRTKVKDAIVDKKKANASSLEI